MGAVEDAVDDAANFISPYLNKPSIGEAKQELGVPQPQRLVEEALSHLDNINIADQAKDPNAPYDASLFGVVYGLLDLVTTLGILPYLALGVAFEQRPQSVLGPTLSNPRSRHDDVLSKNLEVLISIFEQEGVGVQPLLVQRALPDILSATAQLACSPQAGERLRNKYEPALKKVLTSTSTSRLLPIFTTYLQQQDIPTWLRQRLSRELAIAPLRPSGVRHTIEFLSLSFLSKNSHFPQEASGPPSKIPIPLEAIQQASRLLASVPSGMDPKEWFTNLAPQLWQLFDGSITVELSRAAGSVITHILSYRSTGAPGTVGWELFAKPILQVIFPVRAAKNKVHGSTVDQVAVGEHDLKLALQRLSSLASLHLHTALMKRLVHPLLLPLWALLMHAKSRPSLAAQWATLARNILVEHMRKAWDMTQIEKLVSNMFWDGDLMWTFGPGSQGGVEIRARASANTSITAGDYLLSRIQGLDERVNTFISLLSDAQIEDDAAGALFVYTAKRWLSTGQVKNIPNRLTSADDVDPLTALLDVKLTEAIATKFQDKFARSPVHVIQLMRKLLQDFIYEHESKGRDLALSSKPSRPDFGNIVKLKSKTSNTDQTLDTESQDLVSFALSILNTLISSADFNSEISTNDLLSTIMPSLHYLSQPHESIPLPSLITNAATNLLQLLQISIRSTKTQEALQAGHRATLKSAYTELTSPDPPNRTWAVSTIRKLIHDPASFPVVDVPSTTHLILSVSIADPDSYVHTAAIPVLVDLAVRAPQPTLRILSDAFTDVDERSLQLRKEKDIEQALDFRLRVGEVIYNFVGVDEYWSIGSDVTRLSNVEKIVKTTLSVSSRRGNRKKTLTQRTNLSEAERQIQVEAEAAWGGPIPNLLDPEGENLAGAEERDALLKIMQAWEDTGIEEDIRIRSSALSILSAVLENRLPFLDQAAVDAALQMVLQILVIETGIAKAILRRAALLVVMGLLKGTDGLLEEGKQSTAALGWKQAEEVARVVKWVRDEDHDDLVKSHAENVLDGFETWRMKKWFKVSDERFNANLGLQGGLLGLKIDPIGEEEKPGQRRLVVEEIE